MGLHEQGASAGAGRRARVALAMAACTLAVVACSASDGGGGAPAPARAPQSGTGGQDGAGEQTAGPTGPPDPASSVPTDPSRSRRVPAPVTLAFAGDVHFEGSSGRRLAADPNTAVGPMSAVLSRADLAVVNLETAVTTRGVPVPEKAYVFRAPPSAFTALRAAGVDVVSMANNHGMDYGLEGLRDSLRHAQEASFPVIGIGGDAAAAYAPFRAVVDGQRIAVVAATQVLDDEIAAAWTAGPGKPGLASAKNVGRLAAAVRAARADADTVVVFLHWGLEFENCPSAAQTSLVASLTEAGADVIVGSHAHVLQGGGWTPRGAYVHYGLGNFVFYSTGDGPNTYSGVLELTVLGRSVTAANWVPVRLAGGAPSLLTGKAASAATGRWAALRGCTGLAATPPPRPAPTP